MLLEKLIIENYGVYADKSEFDLTTTPEKPIILIGGLNGAGKTTIFESLMVALYGKSYLGRKTTKKEYIKYIAGKIHRHQGHHASSASIQVTFRFYHNGCDDRYVVNRNWTREGASVAESFSVEKNGESMNEIDESQWQSFIEGLIPLGIARLFFFDGEKIIRITEKSQYNDEIKSSLETLLGAEIIKRLYSDLNLYMLRKSGDKTNLVNQEYERMYAEKEQLVTEIESLMTELENKNSEITNANTKIGIKESTISGIGGGYASIRGELLMQKTLLEEESHHQTKQLHEMFAGDAPFYLVPSMLKRITTQLQKDSDVFLYQCASTVESQLESKIKEKMSESSFWSNDADRKLVTSKMLDVLHDVCETKDKKIFFDLSPDDLYQIGVIRKSMKDGHKLLFDNLSQYGNTKLRIEKIESDLVKIPKDDEIGPHISEINEMHQEIGALKSEADYMEQRLASKNAYLKILKNKLKAVIDSIHKDQTSTTGVSLATKMQNVLDTYYVNLKEHKMQELESHMLDITRLLLHKSVIQRIEIDRESFEIKVYGNEKDQIPGNFLAMGERQIIGTALLWAIARTCGRSLPFVIDTPLGRLDGKHRLNITEKFYPFASHQILLLSTDTEIGHKEFSKLEQYVSNSYRIQCNQNLSVTSVTPGYFMEENIAST